MNVAPRLLPYFQHRYAQAAANVGMRLDGYLISDAESIWIFETVGEWRCGGTCASPNPEAANKYPIALFFHLAFT